MKPNKHLTPIIIHKNLDEKKADDAPVSTLRRVVDMSELRAKKPTKPKPQPENDEHRSKKKPEQNAHHDNPHTHRNEPKNAAVHENSSVVDENRVAQCASAPDVREIQNETMREKLESHDAPTPSSSPQLPPEFATAEPRHESHETSPSEKKSARPPLSRHVSEQHARVNRKSHAASKIAEKRILPKKENVAKPRHLKEKLKNDADFHGINEKLDPILRLQTWYARQWTSCLSTFGENFDDLFMRSMPLVQARLVNNICISNGRIEATIFDEITSISVRVFSLGQWRAVISLLSDKAIFTTSVLNGELPEGITDIFKQASLSLFPTKLKDFTFECACGESPCKHVAALLISFATMLEDDPFLILTLRGMSRDALIDEIRGARCGLNPKQKTQNRLNYETPATSIHFESYFEARGDFETLHFPIQFAENTLLDRLGNPSAWNIEPSMHDIFGPLMQNAARNAVHIATPKPEEKEPVEPPQNAPNPTTSERSSHKKQRQLPFEMPDLSFVRHELGREIQDSLKDDAVTTARTILTWLKLRGASDIRTLARRTRLHKPTIEAFLNIFCDAGLCDREGEDEKLQFHVTF